MNALRDVLLTCADAAYQEAARPLIFRSSAQEAHTNMLDLLRRLDRVPAAIAALRVLRRLLLAKAPLQVGRVRLPAPLILAAGMVKGEGFADEMEALAALSAGRNLIPGWKSVPALVGAVEFGSYTRYPRLGNPGTVLWRDPATRSTQNRVGLRNPGARAAAAFLGERRWQLPPVYGINIAVSPGVSDLKQEQVEVLESLAMFVEQRVLPTWFTLNLSCPNTEDDPTGHQTEARTRLLCAAVIAYLSAAAPDVPLWVKVGPDLDATQYEILMRVFAEVGVAAVIATNTLGQPAPDQPEELAGVGGGRIHAPALAAVEALTRAGGTGTVDVIGCGGVIDGAAYQAYRARGAKAVQYWSALVYRGPLAAAHILHEWKQTYG